jgi:hypothetical protein
VLVLETDELIMIDEAEYVDVAHLLPPGADHISVAQAGHQARSASRHRSGFEAIYPTARRHESKAGSEGVRAAVGERRRDQSRRAKREALDAGDVPLDVPRRVLSWPAQTDGVFWDRE